MKKLLLVLLISYVDIQTGLAQLKLDTVTVWTKQWSRDKNRNIVYSDWTPYSTKFIRAIGNRKDPLTQFGGLENIQFAKTGFFRTEKKDGRHFMVDPSGHAFIAVSLNSVRQGGSPLQKSFFKQKYHNDDIEWMMDVRQNMDAAGFNMLGSWSDTAAIRAFNAKHPEKAIPYTTQLSLLAGFAQKERKSTGKKDWSVLAFIFDPKFEAYCLDRLNAVSNMINDPWLVGHFSDNELHFQANLINEFLRINDPGVPAFQLAEKWKKDFDIDTNAVSKEINDQFAGYVAETYFAIVSKVIKKVDPNHLYIGSRLHEQAKGNIHVLKAADKYQDIISINYYGNWTVTDKHEAMWTGLSKPFMITEFYTKAEDSGLPNITGAGWLVKTQAERGYFYQNFCLRLLSMPTCVGWHWFRYQDNDPTDPSSDPSNNDSNKGIVNSKYETYGALIDQMKLLNTVKYSIALKGIK